MSGLGQEPVGDGECLLSRVFPPPQGDAVDIEVDLYRREAYEDGRAWWFGLLWVARCEGVPTGALQTRPDGEVQMVAVDKHFQGRGVASALVQAAELHLGGPLTHDNEVSAEGQALVNRHRIEASARRRATPSKLLPADKAAKAAGELLSTVRGAGPRWMPDRPSDPLVYRTSLGPAVSS